jgi:hypothetical protein
MVTRAKGRLFYFKIARDRLWCGQWGCLCLVRANSLDLEVIDTGLEAVENYSHFVVSECRRDAAIARTLTPQHELQTAIAIVAVDALVALGTDKSFDRQSIQCGNA